MGLVLAISLLVQSPACRTHSYDLFLVLTTWGTIAGGLGSLVWDTLKWSLGRLTEACASLQLDSLMGATVQRTRYSTASSRILTDESPQPNSQVDIKVISGLDILTNSQVSDPLIPILAVSLNI